MGCSNSREEVVYVEILDQCVAPGVIFHEEIQTINTFNRNVASWLPETLPIKATVIVSHGLNEHSLRYYGIAVALAKLGYAVYAIDHVSHGKSDGKRGIIADHTVLYTDFIAFGKSIRELHPSLPMFLLAHSMGTLVAMKSINGIPDLKAVVLSGAAVFSGPAASSPFGIRCLYPLSQTSFAVCLTSVTSVIDPGGPAAPLVITELSSDEAELERSRTDPRVAPPVVTNKSAYELVKLIAEVKEEIPNIKVPFLCIHGAEDLVALPKSSDYIYTHAGTDISERQLHLVPGAKHEPFHETEAIRTAAIQFVVDYFETQFTRCSQQPQEGDKTVSPEGSQLVSTDATTTDAATTNITADTTDAPAAPDAAAVTVVATTEAVPASTEEVTEEVALGTESVTVEV